MSKYIYGINPVLMAIKANKVKKIILNENFSNQSVLQSIKKANIATEFVRKERIDSLSLTTKNQGILALVEEYKTKDLNVFLNELKDKNSSIIVMLDNLQDPHNLGAILRICDAFNVDGIIYKKNNQVKITPSVVKVSTGSINFVDCIEVSNLNNSIDILKKEGYWIYSTDMSAKVNYFDVDYANKTCLVIGSEGFGISRLVKEKSDFIIKIPMSGHVNSLNASNACAIVVSDIYRKLKLK